VCYEAGEQDLAEVSSGDGNHGRLYYLHIVRKDFLTGCNDVFQKYICSVF